MKRQTKTSPIGWFGKRCDDDYYDDTSYALSTASKEVLYAETELTAFKDLCTAALSKQALDSLIVLSIF